MNQDNAGEGSSTGGGLRKTTPYWYEFQTFSKQRWFGRELIEIMTTEFRDRTKEYYVWAIHKGICRVNGKKAHLHQVIGDGDQIQNSVHRHEPPVTDEPIKILHRDDEKGMLVIVKPGSIPVHAAGRYLRHTLTGLLKTEHGIDMVYTTNRLDRLTSGVMVCSTKKETASKLGAQFASGLVNKAYVCRVRGKFPEGEVVCKEPILTIDRQSGVNIVHPKGKYCETIFVRLSYDAETDTSVVFCRPITGRTHQIRVHVQYLGHPISNDPIYGHDIWSKVDTASFAQVIPDQWKKVGGEIGQKEVERIVDAIKGDQDGQEDWARWKDEVLFKEINQQEGLEEVHVPGPNGRSSRPSDELLKRALKKLEEENGELPSKGLNRPKDIETAWQKRVREQSSDFCPECKIPLLPDPKPEELYIYLHAIKYWTDEWTFEDSLPWWAREDWRSIQPGQSSPSSEATLPRDLSVAHKPDSQVSSTPMSSLITSDIEEKAARLANPERYAEQDRGLQITRVRQLVDYPPLATFSPSSSLEGQDELKQAIQKATETATLQVPVVFHVFGGFEDFGQREVAQNIAVRLPPQTQETQGFPSLSSPITTSIHSGHVLVKDSYLSSIALRAYFEAQLGTTKEAYLLTALQEFPLDLARQLKKEKLEGGSSRRARWKARDLRKAIARGKVKPKKDAGEKNINRAIQMPAVLRADENDQKTEGAEAEGRAHRDGVDETASQDSPAVDTSASDVEATNTCANGEETSRSDADVEGDQVFPSEERLLQLLERVWDSSTSQLDAALSGWIRIMEASTGSALRTDQLSYRATVDRSTYNLPSLTSQSMERYVGELAWRWLNGPDDENTDYSIPPKWRVDLEQPLLDVTLKFFPGFGIGDEFEKELAATDDPNLKTQGQIAFMLRLPAPFTQHVRRPTGRNALLVGGTAMAEYRAASLALALPLPTHRKGKDGVETPISNVDVEPIRILEPCCGHGSLVFETASMMESKGLKGEIFGCDLEGEIVERAQAISALAGFSPDSGAVRVHLAAIDGTHPGKLEEFVGGRASMDAIITDLPWGKREKAAQSLSKLYSLFLESWFPVLRTGGYIVAVTAEHRTLTRALAVFETLCQKKRKGAVLRMESVKMLSNDKEHESQDKDEEENDPNEVLLNKLEDEKVKQQGLLDAKRNNKMRKIEIGYHVYVFMIRKVAV